MEPMLDIPKDRNRLPTLRLCLMLAAAVLLFIAAEARGSVLF